MYSDFVMSDYCKGNKLLLNNRETKGNGNLQEKLIFFGGGGTMDTGKYCLKWKYGQRIRK